MATKKSKPKPLAKFRYQEPRADRRRPCEDVLGELAPLDVLDRWIGRLPDHLISRVIKGGRFSLTKYKQKYGIDSCPSVPKKELRERTIEFAQDLGIDPTEEWLKTILPNRGGRGLPQEEIRRRMRAIDFYYPDFKAAARDLQLTENLVRRTYENYKLEGGRYVRVYRYGRYAGRGIDGTENR